MESSTGLNHENSFNSSSEDTETEQPLSSQEDYNFMKTLQPNLSDEINSVLKMKQEQPDCESSQVNKSSSSERNTYWKTGAQFSLNLVKPSLHSGKTLPPSTSSNVNLSTSLAREIARVAPCAEIVSVVTPSNTYYTSSTSIFADRIQQTDFNGGCREEATSSRSPASTNVEPAYKRMREIGWATTYRDEQNQNCNIYKKLGAYGGYPCNDDEGQISSTTTISSFIQDKINTIPADQLSMAGKYIFSMEYETDTTKPAKSCNYTFSKHLKKVFVQVDKIVPFKFVSEISLPAQNVEIRSYLVYKDIHSREIVVDRCPHHLSRQEFSNPHHVMDTIDGHISEHITCPCTHRYITVLRPGVTHSNHQINSFCGNLRFRCASSCRGGIDRRAILALFELYVNNRFSGRSCIEVSICSSPGRDRINQEEKLFKILYPQRPTEEECPQNQVVANEMKDLIFSAKGVLKEGRLFDEETFLIKVKGSKNAELVGRLAKQLNELEDRKSKQK